MTGMSAGTSAFPPTSLWTTPASPLGSPLNDASIDAAVSTESLLEAVAAVKERAAAFSGHVTEELLLQSF